MTGHFPARRESFLASCCRNSIAPSSRGGTGYHRATGPRCETRLVLKADGWPSPPETAKTPGSGVGGGLRVGVLEFRIHPAFPVLFRCAHHGPHRGELGGVAHARLAAGLDAVVLLRRHVV